MNADFSRIITLLRSERNLTQKQAAEELGISQALLSHYERGVRECGLDFLVKIADFYGVSCDYLLGRSPERTGALITPDEIPDPEGDIRDNRLRGSAMVMLNKKLVCNSLNVLYDFLQHANSKSLTTEVSGYLMLSVYKMFRTVYSANSRNPQSMFSVSANLFPGVSSAAMLKTEAVICAIAAGKPPAGMDKINDTESISTTEENLVQAYPKLAPSLLNLVRYAEARID